MALASGCSGSNPPSHVAGLSGSTFPPEDRDVFFDRTLKQETNNTKTELSIQIPKYLHEYYKRRHRTRDYGSYIADRHDDEYITNIAGSIREFVSQNELPKMAEGHLTSSIVQNLEYTPDGPGQGYEYPQFPIETLYERGGDCEDTSILAGAILEKLGYEVILVGLPEIQHMVVGVGGRSIPEGIFSHNGTRYAYLETTGAGWKLGELPSLVKSYFAEKENPKIVVFEADTSPVLVFRWQTSLTESNEITIKITLANAGDKVARDVKFETLIESHEGVEERLTNDDVMDIPPEKGVEFDGSANPPSDRDLRIRMNVYLNGQLHDYDQTGWQRPA